MRFTLHDGSTEAVVALKGEEPLPAEQCLPQRLDLPKSLGQVTWRVDGDPPTEWVVGVQDPLPGLETPPCR